VAGNSWDNSRAATCVPRDSGLRSVAVTTGFLVIADTCEDQVPNGPGASGSRLCDCGTAKGELAQGGNGALQKLMAATTIYKS